MPDCKIHKIEVLSWLIVDLANIAFSANEYPPNIGRKRSTEDSEGGGQFDTTQDLKAWITPPWSESDHRMESLF